MTRILFVVLVLALAAACQANAPETPTPEPGPTLDPTLKDHLDQAAGQAPFTLLLLDQTALFEKGRLTQLEIHPGEEDRPFSVVQIYRVPGGEIRITQSSLVTGQAPEKAVEEVQVRGRDGYWLVLNTGQRALYWEEEDSSLATTGDLEDENTLRWAEALTVYEARP